jgi:hypothetical protein
VRHQVFIADRGGAEADIKEEITGLTQVKWGRIRDGVSEAQIDMRFKSTACEKLLTQPRLAMRYEVIIKRDGERVWEGPIDRRNLSGGAAKLFCRDVLLFTQRTPCLNKWSSAFADGGPEFVTARTMRILNGEMGIWSTWGANLLPHIIVKQTASTAKTTRVTLPGSQYVWDDMEELAARSGMDYTVVNRSLYLHDTHQFLGMGRRLTDADFLADLEVVEYGLELATRSVVNDGQGHYATRSVTGDEFYGPFGLLASAYDVKVSTDRIPLSELEEQAARNIRSRYPTPLILRVPENAQLRPSSVDELMPFLIPGTGFPVYSIGSGLEVQQVQKLDRVDFLETEQGETVTVALSAAPIGAGLEDAGIVEV